MNKHLLLVVLGVLFTWNAHAQFNLGPKVGINTGVDSYDEFEKLTNLSSSGTHVGIFGRAELAFLYIQPELLYSINNLQTELLNDDGSTSVLDYKNNRVDLPIMAGLRFFKFLRVGAGPVFSVVTSDSLTGATNNTVGFKNSTAGFQVNAGLDIWKIILDLKYESGAGDLSDNVLGVPSDYRPQQLSFSIGIKLF
jgi:hypothetical protein